MSDSVDHLLAAPADGDDRPYLPQAVSHLLGDAPGLAEPCREIGGGEQFGQSVREQSCQVLEMTEPQRVHHFDQSAFEDRPTMASP